MADEKKMEIGKNGLLGDTGKSLGHFINTPKHTDDSSKTTTMARFTVDETLTEAIKKRLAITTTDSNLLTGLSKEGYFDFLLLGMSNASQDRYQLVETMGKNFVLFGFNEAPEILTCQGVLKNTVENDWKVQFLKFFKEIGGISSLAKFYQYGGENVANFLNFIVDGVVYEGALVSVSHSITSANEMDIPFSFSYVVTGTRNLGAIGESSTHTTTAEILAAATQQAIIDNNNAKQRIIERASVELIKNGALGNPATSKLIADNYKKEYVG